MLSLWWNVSIDVLAYTEYANNYIHDDVSEVSQTLKENQIAIGMEENDNSQAKSIGLNDEITNVDGTEIESTHSIRREEYGTEEHHACIDKVDSVIIPSGRTNLGFTENALCDKTVSMSKFIVEKGNKRKQEMKERINEVLKTTLFANFARNYLNSFLIWKKEVIANRFLNDAMGVPDNPMFLNLSIDEMLSLVEKKCEVQAEKRMSVLIRWP